MTALEELIVGNDSLGKRPYKSRPRKSTAAKRSPAKPKPSSSSVADSAKDLDPSRRTTTEERRAVLVAALRLASSLADDPSMPPSARTGALTNARQLLAQIQAEDALDPRQPIAWGSIPVEAS